MADWTADTVQVDTQMLRKFARAFYVLERPTSYGQERYYQERAGEYRRSIEAMLGEKIRLEDEDE